MLYSSRGEVEASVAQGLVSDYVAATAVEMDVTPESIEPHIEGHQNFPGGFRDRGDFLIAELDGLAAGCLGIRRVGEQTCEMKSLWVGPEWRGRGLARALIEASLLRAKEMGYQQMGLDVLPTRQAAIALYRKLGFVPCPCFHEYEFEMVGLSRALLLDLT